MVGLKKKNGRIGYIGANNFLFENNIYAFCNLLSFSIIFVNI